MIWIVLGIIVILAILFVSVYNNLVTSRNFVHNAFANIDTQLQRRFDLIPNLVETVKGYASHESKVLENVTAARSGYMNAKTPDEKMKADNALTGTLKTLFAVAESYPELKANQNFSKLQEDLKGTEDKIAFSRQFYNDAVTMYNDKLLVFPNNIIGGMFGFKTEALYKIDNDSAKQTPKVQF